MKYLLLYNYVFLYISYVLLIVFCVIKPEYKWYMTESYSFVKHIGSIVLFSVSTILLLICEKVAR